MGIKTCEPGLGNRQSPPHGLFFQLDTSELMFVVRRECCYSAHAMFFENSYRDNQPLTQIGRLPVYGTTIVVAAIAVGVLISALAGYGVAAAILAFEPNSFWRHGQVWRALSYLMVEQIDFFTIFNLLFIYGFGRDCEQEMGRRRYFAFLGLLVVTPLLLATLLWLVGFDGGVIGSTHLAIGLVIAFATIYPDVEWLASIPMKFVAIGCMFLAAVGHLSVGDEIGLGCTLATCAVSWAYIRAMRAGIFDGIPWPGFSLQKFKARRSAAREGDTREEMDRLLDKISKSGLASLTSKERFRLEAARDELMKSAK